MHRRPPGTCVGMTTAPLEPGADPDLSPDAPDPAAPGAPGVPDDPETQGDPAESSGRIAST